jgi:hypothetical protein
LTIHDICIQVLYLWSLISTPKQKLNSYFLGLKLDIDQENCADCAWDLSEEIVCSGGVSMILRRGLSDANHGGFPHAKRVLV